jgi:ribonuclease P protein component
VSHPYSFSARHRLHNTAEFDRVYRTGRRAGDGLFAVNVLANGLDHPRLGMSVSTKTVGNSVCRNRVRRLIREVFRHRSPEFPAVDFVVTSRPGARAADRPALLTSLERLFGEAVRKAAAPPAPPVPPRP